MNSERLNNILKIGETVAVEFKRCGNGIESDVYESICAFLNRFGGDLFMGVLDNGSVVGVSEKSAVGMVKNFIAVISNPNLFSPTIYLDPEIIKYENKTIIHVHVPPSAEVHSFKKVIYDRVNESDVKVTATGQIAQMYIRKQNIFTEKRIYQYVEMGDLRLDLLPKLRQLAVNNAGGNHPWAALNDEELLKSAGLYGLDHATGQRGYNLAAVMLLGKDDLITDICPTYVTDALLRKVNMDRYDDRDFIKTNLVESYDRLMNFAVKHLPDKFFLEDTQRKSLRNIIAREMLVNTLIHREFTSSYIAKFVIEKDKMYVENANRAATIGYIKPDTMEPNPKNPIIADFFRNIGRSDKLGSGVRNIFKYSKYYSGKDPEFIEGDIFKIIVPLDDDYSYDENMDEQVNNSQIGGNEPVNGAISGGDSLNEPINEPVNGDGEPVNEPVNGDGEPVNEPVKSKGEIDIILAIQNDPSITKKKLSEKLNFSLSTVKRIMNNLREKGLLIREGSDRKGYWRIKNN